MKKFLAKYIFLILVFVPSVSFAQVDANIFPNTDSIAKKAPQALLYVMATRKGLESLRKNINSIDVVAPQTYTVNQYGKLFGKPKQEILDIARMANVPVMPLVSNVSFNQKTINSFLRNQESQAKLLASLVAEAKDKKYIGYQYDFEHIPSYDRDLYSDFIRKSAPVFHLSGLKLSVAVAPLHSDNPNDYGDGSWQNWTGAFDYSEIGKAADFVSIMAYDDSKSKGPTASLPWANEVAAYSLTHIPAEKISFGIAFYAWVRNPKTNKRESIVTYPALASFIDGNYLDKGWSEELGVPWVKYRTSGGKKRIAWYEDSRSFDKKIALIQRTKMMGFSAWAIGQEDPAVWDRVVAMRDGTSYVAMR